SFPPSAPPTTIHILGIPIPTILSLSLIPLIPAATPVAPLAVIIFPVLHPLLLLGLPRFLVLELLCLPTLFFHKLLQLLLERGFPLLGVLEIRVFEHVLVERVGALAGADERGHEAQ